MKREIYEVYAKVVDANGAYNTLSGYPKYFDSHQFSDSIDKARNRALGEYHEVLGAMYKRDDRQEQFAMIIQASTGTVIEAAKIGKIADLPDPKYSVTVTNGTGAGSYVEGAVVSIAADEPEEGMMFSGWLGTDGLVFTSGNVNTPEASFIMPANAVTVEATYAEIPEPEEE